MYERNLFDNNDPKIFEIHLSKWIRKRFEANIHNKYPSLFFTQWILKFGLSQKVIIRAIIMLKKTNDIKWRYLLCSVFDTYKPKFDLTNIFVKLAKYKFFDIIAYAHLFGFKPVKPKFINMIEDKVQLQKMKSHGYDITNKLNEMVIKSADYEECTKLLDDKNKTQNEVFELLCKCTHTIFVKCYNEVIMKNKPKSVQTNINADLMNYASKYKLLNIVMYLMNNNVAMTPENVINCFGLRKKPNRGKSSKKYKKTSKSMRQRYLSRSTRITDTFKSKLRMYYDFDKTACIQENNQDTLCEFIKLCRLKNISIVFDKIKIFINFLLVYKCFKLVVELMTSIPEKQRNTFRIKLKYYYMYHLISCDDSELFEKVIMMGLINVVKFQKQKIYLLNAIHYNYFNIARYMINNLKMKYREPTVYELCGCSNTQYINMLKFLHESDCHISPNILKCALVMGYNNSVEYCLNVLGMKMKNKDVYNIIVGHVTIRTNKLNFQTFIKYFNILIKNKQLSVKSALNKLISITGTRCIGTTSKNGVFIITNLIKKLASTYNISLLKFDNVIFTAQNYDLIAYIYSDNNAISKITPELVKITINQFENTQISYRSGGQYPNWDKYVEYKKKMKDNIFDCNLFNLFLFLKKVRPDIVNSEMEKYQMTKLVEIYKVYIDNATDYKADYEVLHFFDIAFGIKPNSSTFAKFIKNYTFEDRIVIDMIKTYSDVVKIDDELKSAVLEHGTVEFMSFLIEYDANTKIFFTQARINMLLYEGREDRLIRYCIDNSNYKFTPYIYRVLKHMIWNSKYSIERYVTFIKSTILPHNVPIERPIYEHALVQARTCNCEKMIKNINLTIIDEYHPTDDEIIPMDNENDIFAQFDDSDLSGSDDE
jgi:hypothetical protein